MEDDNALDNYEIEEYSESVHYEQDELSSASIKDESNDLESNIIGADSSVLNMKIAKII